MQAKAATARATIQPVDNEERANASVLASATPQVNKSSAEPTLRMVPARADERKT